MRPLNPTEPYELIYQAAMDGDEKKLEELIEKNSIDVSKIGRFCYSAATRCAQENTPKAQTALKLLKKFGASSFYIGYGYGLGKHWEAAKALQFLNPLFTDKSGQGFGESGDVNMALRWLKEHYAEPGHIVRGLCCAGSDLKGIDLKGFETSSSYRLCQVKGHADGGHQEKIEEDLKKNPELFREVTTCLALRGHEALVDHYSTEEELLKYQVHRKNFSQWVVHGFSAAGNLDAARRYAERFDVSAIFILRGLAQGGHIQLAKNYIPRVQEGRDQYIYFCSAFLKILTLWRHNVQALRALDYLKLTNDQIKIILSDHYRDYLAIGSFGSLEVLLFLDDNSIKKMPFDPFWIFPTEDDRGICIPPSAEYQLFVISCLPEKLEYLMNHVASLCSPKVQNRIRAVYAIKKSGFSIAQSLVLTEVKFKQILDGFDLCLMSDREADEKNDQEIKHGKIYIRQYKSYCIEYAVYRPDDKKIKRSFISTTQLPELKKLFSVKVFGQTKINAWGKEHLPKLLEITSEKGHTLHDSKKFTKENPLENFFLTALLCTQINIPLPVDCILKIGFFLLPNCSTDQDVLFFQKNVIVYLLSASIKAYLRRRLSWLIPHSESANELLKKIKENSNMSDIRALIKLRQLKLLSESVPTDDPYNKILARSDARLKASIATCYA